MIDLNLIKFHTAEQKNYFVSLMDNISYHYKENLSSIIIFGSMANQSNRLNSDCDLFIVLKSNKTSSKIYLNRDFSTLETSLEEKEIEMRKSGVSMEISPIIVNKNQAAKFNPLYLDMVDNNILIYDKDNYMQSILFEMKKRFISWGSTKHPVGNGWYWEIKQDIKLGEEINYD